MKKGKDMGHTACLRIRALAKEIGADMNYQRGWYAEAARCMNLPYPSMYEIVTNRNKRYVSTKTISTVTRAIGLTPNELMEG